MEKGYGCQGLNYTIEALKAYSNELIVINTDEFETRDFFASIDDVIPECQMLISKMSLPGPVCCISAQVEGSGSSIFSA